MIAALPAFWSAFCMTRHHLMPRGTWSDLDRGGAPATARRCPATGSESEHPGRFAVGLRQGVPDPRACGANRRARLDREGRDETRYLESLGRYRGARTIRPLKNCCANFTANGKARSSRSLPSTPIELESVFYSAACAGCDRLSSDEDDVLCECVGEGRMLTRSTQQTNVA